MEDTQNLVPEEQANMQLDTSLYREVYDDTLYFVEGIISEYDFYPDILRMFREGNISVDLKKRYTIKSIDEMWVKAIEDSLVALDAVIRNPNRFIEEQEQILPIELSHNINSRSVSHLAQHTDYISKVEGDDITPSKILNVFHEETMLTYENKFVNTLINRLFGFVARRYDAIFGNGRSEKSTALNFAGNFNHGGIKGKLHFGIEISEDPEQNILFNGKLWSSDLDQRVEKLYRIVQNYISSEFVKNMGQAFVRPPIMRTNPIMKNKNLRQCLALWQFIESYEGTGYEVFVQENAEKIDDAYVDELYSTCALQYLIFRYKIKNDFEVDNELAHAITAEPFRPKFIDEIKQLNADDYNIFDTQYMKVVPYYQVNPKRHLSASEKRIGRAIDIALEADPIFDQMRIEAKRRRLEEEERRRIEEERRRIAEEEARIRAAEEAEARRKAEEEAARVAEIEAARLAAEEEARRKAEEEAARAAAEEAARLAAEEEARRIAEEEAARAAAEEAARIAAEEEAARIAAEEAARKAAEEAEAARIAAEEAARKAAEEEEARRIALEEARARAAEEAEARRIANEEARIRAAEDARRRAEINKRIGRKKKKNIRRAAEQKAEVEDVTLSRVFDYEEYMRFLNDDDSNDQTEE